MTRENNHGKSGRLPLFLLRKSKQKRLNFRLLCFAVFALSVAGLLGYGIFFLWQSASTKNTHKELQSLREGAGTFAQYEMLLDKNRFPIAGVATVFADIYKDIPTGEESSKAPEILPKYQTLYEMNPDLAGWLVIDDTIIDYPVMQTMEDECYYLRLDFYGEPNQNGCLILDTDSTAGTGTKVCGYENGTTPSTNLIIHGHNMKSGEMFGKLMLYADEEYAVEHNIIRFDSLYEEREYELIAVFYSQVYYESDNVFKYYKFFQADTQEEFDDWYENIKAMSLYDTGVTAQFGDEFITLSCCSYHVEDGRFVVVGKRVK
ncbi:MAG: class B sortase [Agathobacter sp.]